MSLESLEPLPPDRLPVDEPREQQVLYADVDDSMAPLVAAPKPGGPPSEDDQVEDGFDNMPV